MPYFQTIPGWYGLLKKYVFTLTALQGNDFYRHGHTYGSYFGAQDVNVKAEISKIKLRLILYKQDVTLTTFTCLKN